MPPVLSFFLKLLIPLLAALSSHAEVTVTTSTKGWSKTEVLNNLGLTTNSALSGTGVPAATLTPTWRDDGSLYGVTFTTGGDTHSATFKDNGTLATLIAPGNRSILPANGHTISGGLETLTVDGTTTERRLDGTAVETSGSDVIGKTEELIVSGGGFKRTTTPAVGAATEVVLNAAGTPTAKNYAAGAGEAYGYENGLLHNITLARGGDLTFGYSDDGAKDLESATWPAVASGVFTVPSVVQGYGHDRAGRIDEIGDASGARAMIYQNGRLKETVWTSGPLAGYKIVKGIDGNGRDTGFELWRGNSLIHSAVKAPNGVSGEISEMTSGDLKVVIGRNGARQITGFQWGNANGTFIPSVTQHWQRGTAGRIEEATSDVSGAPAFDYLIDPQTPEDSFDPKGRRLKCATAGGEWSYQYTNGQLTSAIHPTLGSFIYQFDAIGRRKNHATSNNHADLLNRTLDWENSQSKSLKITADPAAKVRLNGTEIPDFNGSHIHPVQSPGPSGGWVAWNTLAVLEGQGDITPGANPDAEAEQSGAVWVPPVSESFEYDAAGNRESTALWNYGWNAKNELVRARTKDYSTAAQGYDVTNAFDAEGRRFSKKVNRYQNGDLVEQKVITFIHDGNHLIYEREQLPSGLSLCERKYVWGPDIAGGNAGGAGGLLLIRETKGNSTIDLYPLYDGTGHVVALTDSTGTLQAEYAYGPFGETIHARGPKANSCPFRYATKYYDSETGLHNFGLRFLDPITGQWLSREPLGESESLNLYSYAGNDPINYVDVLGLAKVPINQADKSLIDLALRYGLINEDAGSGAIIDTAVLNSLLTANGESPILWQGFTSIPTMVCHGASSSGHIEGVSRLYSMVNGQVHSSTGNADMMRKIGAGAWGNTRGMAGDLGNLIAFVANGSANAVGELAGIEIGFHLEFYQMPLDADGWRSAGQQQVYPGINGDNLMVGAGGALADAVFLFAGPEALAAKAPGWSVKLSPKLNLLNYRPALGVLNGPFGVPSLSYRLPWSSGQVNRAARLLESGETSITLATRSQAEELILRLYHGQGMRNTTGLSGSAVRGDKFLFPRGKLGTYHWDDTLDSAGRVTGHGLDNAHGALPHVQVHDFGGNIIRIFYGQ